MGLLSFHAQLVKDLAGRSADFINDQMKRKALFVGINEYNDMEIADLRFAISDAVALYGQFVGLGFDSKCLIEQDTTREKILKSFKEFTGDLEPGDVFLFYFAGHGYSQIGSGEQLLVARDDVLETISEGCGGGVPYHYLRRTLEKQRCHSIFVLDACRSNILANTRGGRDLIPAVPKERLVGRSESGSTTVVMRSCSPGQCAREIPKLGHGLYTYALSEVIKKHIQDGCGLSFDAGLSDAVAQKISAIAAANGITGRQEPEFIKAGLGLPCVWPLGGMTKHDGSARAMDSSLAVGAIDSPVRVEQPKTESSQVLDLPLYRIIDLKTGEMSGFEAVPNSGWSDEYKTTKLVLRRIDPGTFMMGSPIAEQGRSEDEVPHRVTLSKAFYIGVFEVSQAQWQCVMKSCPAYFSDESTPSWLGMTFLGEEVVRMPRDKMPVEQVSWEDCQRFCYKLSNRLRMPTEAEWEYACRAGTSTAYAWGVLYDDMRANSNGGACISMGKTCDVGSYPPNDWGLYDMHGNVFEWCADWYGAYTGDATDSFGPAMGTERVCRGGSWKSIAQYCRSAYRRCYMSNDRKSEIGFRVCCSA